MATVVLSTLTIIITIVWGFFFNKKLEGVKSLQRKREFVHELQFKKEFEIYEDLWSDLLTLNESLAEYLLKTSMLRATTDIIKLNQLTQTMFGNTQGFFIKVAKNKPFFSQQIYLKIQALERDVFNLPTSIYQKELDPQKYREELVKRTENMSEILENISVLIRERITLLNDAK